MPHEEKSSQAAKILTRSLTMVRVVAKLDICSTMPKFFLSRRHFVTLSPCHLSPCLIVGADSIIRRIEIRRGARAADRAGLENRCGRKFTEGSNPSLSADRR